MLFEGEVDGADLPRGIKSEQQSVAIGKVVHATILLDEPLRSSG